MANNSLLAPDDIQRPGLARDPGVQARPTAALPTRIEDPLPSAGMQFAQSMESLSGTFREIHEKRQSVEDQMFVDNLQLRMAKEIPTIESEAISSPDASKPEFPRLLDKRIDDRQKAIMDEMTANGQFNPSVKGRAAAQHMLMGMRTEAARRASVAAHNERLKFFERTAMENVTEAARTAGATGQLEAGNARLDQIVGSLSGMLSESARYALLEKGRQEIFRATANGYEDRGEWSKLYSMLDSNRGFATNDTERNVATIAAKHGQDPRLLVSFMRAESSGNGMAKSATSSAFGYFGITAATAKDLGLPADPKTWTLEQQADAAARLMQRNSVHLKNTLGRDPTQGEQYLAWFLGAGGAEKVLRANPNTPIEQLVSNDAIIANEKILRGKTAQDIADWATNKMLANGGGGSLRYIDEKMRVELLNRAEAQEERARNRDETKNEKFRVIMSDHYLKQAYDLASQGKLTDAFVEEARPWLKPEPYQGLKKMMKSDEGHIDNPILIEDFVRRIDESDPSEYMNDVLTAYRNKQIKQSTALALTSRNRAARKDDMPGSPLSIARKHLTTTLTPSIMDAKQYERSALANATKEFDQWAASPDGKKATPNEIIKKGEEVTARYSLISYEQMEMSLGMSPYFPVRNRNQIPRFTSEADLTKWFNDAKNLLMDDNESRLEKIGNNEEQIKIEKDRAAKELDRINLIMQNRLLRFRTENPTKK